MERPSPLREANALMTVNWRNARQGLRIRRRWLNEPRSNSFIRILYQGIDSIIYSTKRNGIIKVYLENSLGEKGSTSPTNLKREHSQMMVAYEVK